VGNTKQLWRGVLIEANVDRFRMLEALHKPMGNLCLNVAVSGLLDSPNNLVSIISSRCPELDSNLDFLCIDIDGSDYWLLHDVLASPAFRPRVICIEFNPTMPDDLVYIPPRSDTVRHGASLAALVELAETFGYTLVETTLFNAFFVESCLYQDFLKDKYTIHRSKHYTSLRWGPRCINSTMERSNCGGASECSGIACR
jgi:hypothetical protein